MIVRRDKPRGFTPVHITLETQAEVDALWHMIVVLCSGSPPTVENERNAVGSVYRVGSTPANMLRQWWNMVKI